MFKPSFDLLKQHFFQFIPPIAGQRHHQWFHGLWRGFEAPWLLRSFIWWFPKMGVPNSWMVKGKSINGWELGVSPFIRKPSFREKKPMVLYSGIQFGHSEKAWRLGLLMTSLESLYELKIQAVCFGNPMVLCLPVKGDPDTLENQSSDCCELVSLTHIHITHPDPSDCCGSTATNIFFFWLVLWNMFYDFPFSWECMECHHPNWRTPSFFQMVIAPPTRLLLTIINHH